VKNPPEHQEQPLRPVDPDLVVQGGAAGPGAGNGAVAALVGGERGVEERQAEQDAGHERRRDGRLGPPRARIDRSTALLAAVAFAAALGAQILTFGFSLTFDRYVLVLLAPALVLGRGRRFMLDFVPFVVLIVLYEECRGIAHLLRPDPYYTPHLDAEKLLFGGGMPPVALQDWLWHGTLAWYDHALSLINRIHFIVPPTLAFALWLRRRALYFRFAATMVILSYAAAITFALYPAAPPWAAAELGLIDPLASPAGVQAATAPLPTSGGPVYQLIDGNPYAAIPSLHAGYSFLVFLFVATLAPARHRRWVVPLAALYPLAQSFSAVYTGNHYVVDLLIGDVFAAAIFLGVLRVWRWRGWPE
jgi:membrane-associated phospholipid phosphatase